MSYVHEYDSREHGLLDEIDKYKDATIGKIVVHLWTDENGSISELPLKPELDPLVKPLSNHTYIGAISVAEAAVTVERLNYLLEAPSVLEEVA
jgi:hypothetical protein